MTCQIDRCQDFEHHSIVMLENHINKCHLDLIHIPCPTLGEFSDLPFPITVYQSYYNLQVVFTQWLLLKANILTF